MKKNVFVVHGRDHGVKNAMFTFLRCLGLRPLEWEQARQLTQLSSPTVLETIRAGIENSQAIVVLLSGDDLAKLRSEFGDEDQEFQPRPNVLFEAGWALATAGQERTILVTFSPLRRISDIDGIHYVFMNNSPEARRSLIARLETAGCELDTSGSDYLSASAGGDFEQSHAPMATDLKTYSEILERGRFTEFLADGSLSLSVNSIDLNKRLFSDIRDSSFIDLKYHYLGPTCASHWINLCQHPEYGHRELKYFITGSASEFSEAIKRHFNSASPSLDVVSLGPGEGSIDTDLLYALSEESININYYYCIDISFELLQHAVSEICRKAYIDESIRVKAIHGDFTELARLSPIYSFDDAPNIFTLTGYTLGNFNEAQLLASIRQGMMGQDLLLVDARLHDMSQWDGKRELTENEKADIVNIHSYDLNDRFAIGPVELAAQIESRSEMKYDINRNITVVPRALNVEFYCTDFKAQVRSTGQQIDKERLDLACTTMYSFSDLEEWFSRKGFDVIWSKQSSQMGLFLLAVKTIPVFPHPAF